MNHLAQLGVASLMDFSKFDDMLDQPPKRLQWYTPQWGELKLWQLRFALVTLATSENCAPDSTSELVEHVITVIVALVLQPRWPLIY